MHQIRRQEKRSRFKIYQMAWENDKMELGTGIKTNKRIPIKITLNFMENELLRELLNFFPLPIHSHVSCSKKGL